MTTRDPRPPRPPADGRDLRVAAWLAVDPLDEVTRGRLVRAALDATESASAPTRPARRLAAAVAVAAALLVILLVGLAVLVPRTEDTRPTALDAPAGKRAAGVDAAPESAGASVPAVLVLPSIGDLGDVSTPDRLARAARPRLPPTIDSTSVTVSGCAVAAGRAFGTPTAAGTARIDGRRAVVIVTEQPAGTTAAVAVEGRTCDRAVSVLLS
jgi:hypothetical protein